MNTIILHGIIKDIQFSHFVNDIEYYKANLLCKRDQNKEDVIPLKFKRFCNPYNEGETIDLIGNVRTYSITDSEGKNHVMPYVFTYFDIPEETAINKVTVDGNICKKAALRKTQTGIDVLDFTLANNLNSNNQIFNTYLPVVAWGKLAKLVNSKNVGDKITIEGHFVSRAYKKKISEDDFEFRIAYELNVDKVLDNNA